MIQIQGRHLYDAVNRKGEKGINSTPEQKMKKIRVLHILQLLKFEKTR